ncbi:hypothetical protein WOLCODRAFT_151900 [Wolfiporia cocos MD-104 SS10]|uniref:Uncharacterized protein n=1 Tax=Wolfiporia cocos (strain MD-104) TaxID=742152 RepID=A0A2H3JI57_WOLCO|nr:hypothetical protein WOLCODRAFT_151900 [Wolfiporia cocos MD-104 SS10]
MLHELHAHPVAATLGHELREGLLNGLAQLGALVVEHLRRASAPPARDVCRSRSMRSS